MKSHRNYPYLFSFLLILLTMFILYGCQVTTRRNSSVYEYLYPEQKGHVETVGVPVLSLPIRIGIAFVPEPESKRGPGIMLTEKEKVSLMTEVGNHFKKYDFIKEIEIIPSPYLTANGSFANLDQIRTMYGLDLITLLSYDQTQFTHEGMASITYWTLIGAYMVPGEKNDTHTMIDAAVFDIKSRKMLFRSPGISHIKGVATPVNLTEALKEDSIKGFYDASVDVVKNLDIQLEIFKEKIKERPEEYKVVRETGYTGGGSLDKSYLMFFIFMGLFWIYSKRQQKE